MSLLRLFTTSTILFVLLYYVNRAIQGPFSHSLFLGLASFSFLIIAIISWRLQPSKYAVLILYALLFCFFGDIIGPFWFMGGGTAFLIAHIFYFLAFKQLGITREFYKSFIIWFSLCLLFLFLLYHLATVNVLNLFIYLTVLSLMIAGTFALRPGTPRNLLRLAAVLFFASDLALLAWNAEVASFYWLCYPLYYLSCILFAWSPLFLFPSINK